MNGREEEDRWRIKEFAARVGVQEVTLRAWERRYNLLQPERSSGGFRLYSRADERRIRSMQAHMTRGIAAAQAAALAVAESTADRPPPPARPGELVDALIVAAKSFDATRIDLLLDAAFARGSVNGVREFVLPALVEIGLQWERGQITVGQEHFASHLIERRLLTLAAGWGEGNGPLALLAGPSGERHTLGLICFGLALAERGWRIAYLGADTPIDQIVDAGTSLSPEVVVLCALQARYLTDHAAEIAELGRRQHTILAGAGATATLAQKLGVAYAGGDPLAEARALAERPSSPSSPSATTA
ncbi:MAG TPA: MerR family transcriptional regulator [Solirubrobacteraceae bacterium]|nr:MerR family transcriptional regulator [Solirubrobacteraceae bacterium]